VVTDSRARCIQTWNATRLASSCCSRLRSRVSMYSVAKPFWYSSAENALASSSNASSRLTAARVSRDRLPSDTRPTAQTTPTAATVPSDASASRIDRRERFEMGTLEGFPNPPAMDFAGASPATSTCRFVIGPIMSYLRMKSSRRFSACA
jgi:hypothetical protein